ncbi:MAG: hypothetical protein ACRD25_02265, partial [Terracidiphilus sp.]
MKHRRKGIFLNVAALGLALAFAGAAGGQMPPSQPSASQAVGPPPSTGGFFPLSQVHAGLMGTAWTVFSGTKPEPMGVEVLGVLRNARGPHQDLILVRLT